MTFSTAELFFFFFYTYYTTNREEKYWIKIMDRIENCDQENNGQPSIIRVCRLITDHFKFHSYRKRCSHLTLASDSRSYVSKHWPNIPDTTAWICSRKYLFLFSKQLVLYSPCIIYHKKSTLGGLTVLGCCWKGRFTWTFRPFKRQCWKHDAFFH